MILLIVCLVVMAGLVAGLFGYAHHMGNKKPWGSRIKIFGEDVSGLTVEETAKKLADDFQKIPVTFQENGETDYQTTLGDLGYSIDETQLKKRSENSERQTLERRRLLPETGGSYRNVSGEPGR